MRSKVRSKRWIDIALRTERGGMCLEPIFRQETDLRIAIDAAKEDGDGVYRCSGQKNPFQNSCNRNFEQLDDLLENWRSESRRECARAWVAENASLLASRFDVGYFSITLGKTGANENFITFHTGNSDPQCERLLSSRSLARHFRSSRHPQCEIPLILKGRRSALDRVHSNKLGTANLALTVATILEWEFFVCRRNRKEHLRWLWLGA